MKKEKKTVKANYSRGKYKKNKKKVKSQEIKMIGLGNTIGTLKLDELETQEKKVQDLSEFKLELKVYEETQLLSLFKYCGSLDEWLNFSYKYGWDDDHEQNMYIFTVKSDSTTVLINVAIFLDKLCEGEKS